MHLIMPSSLKERFQVFMTPDVDRLSANFKTMVTDTGGCTLYIQYDLVT